MAEQADLIMINAGKATNLELMISTMHLGNKTWFYIDPEVVDKNLRILLNTINANMFNDSEQLHNMLKAFLGNG
jgi:hypothetical protein